MTTGDRVFHKEHGFGKVLSEWGCWRACQICYAPYCQAHDQFAKDEDGELIVNNKGEPIPRFLEINGEGIFDVLFGNEIFSINQRWLKSV